MGALKFSSFFFNDTATTEIYTLSLHDALPICLQRVEPHERVGAARQPRYLGRQLLRLAAVPAVGEEHHDRPAPDAAPRSEEHTSELQSRQYLVCRLLLEKNKQTLQKLVH